MGGITLHSSTLEKEVKDFDNIKLNMSFKMQWIVAG